MAGPCTSCGGMSYGALGPNGYEDTGVPCPACNPDSEPKAPGSFAPKSEGKNSVEVMDGEYRPGMEDERGTDAAGAGFSPEAIAQQQARDAEAMRRSGMGGR